MEKSKGTSIEKAIGRMDSAEVLRLVDARGDISADEALRSLWASDALFDKRASKKQEKRERFLEAVAVGLEVRYPDIAAKIRELPALLTLIEKGYVSVLTQTKATVGGALPPLTQVSAALALAAQTAEQLRELGIKQHLNSSTIELKANLTVGDETVHADTALNGTIAAAVSTVMMMAHEQNWFNSNDEVELPSLLSTPSSDEINAISSVLRWAGNWSAWERSQLRMRLAMRSPEYLEKPFPEGFPEFASTALRVLPYDEFEIADFIANNRLVARTQQHYFELIHKLGRIVEPDLEKATPLLPAALLSFDEVHGLNTIMESLSYDVLNDSTTYEGLRIVEWLRGYSTLKRISETYQNVDGAQHQCPQVTEAELIEVLGRVGLTPDRAAIFLQHACLTKSRNDIFDRPLIRVGAHHYVMVAPALQSAVLGPIVLSAISDAGCQFTPKGKAFEEKVREVLSGPGRKVGAFKATRDGEEYEYDALMVWGDYCFLLECKNRSLSAGILQQVYRSELESRSHAHQVHRLVDGLMKYPDMLDKNLPEARGKILVPCVINALPYSLPGGVEEVLFGDYSMLKRFFASATMGQVGLRQGQPAQRVPGSETFRLWAADEPDALDLLRHLICPFQYVLTQAHVNVNTVLSDIFSSSDLLHHGEYVMSDMTIESSRAAADEYESIVPMEKVAKWKDTGRRLP